jgi:cell division protein ZapE
MVFNDLQNELLNLLKTCFRYFVNFRYLRFLPSRFLPKVGVYVYGNVGSGKTTIMRTFFDHQRKLKKQFIHYQKLIKSIHQESANFSDKGRYIDLFAKKHFHGTYLLCIDELEIKDPADAVIMHHLLEQLKEMKVFVALSSNFHPDDFANSVLNKELIKPLIDFFLQKYQIFNLSSQVDYRMSHEGGVGRIFSPGTKSNVANFNHIISNLTQPYEKKVVELENFGRRIVLENTFGPILITDFSKMCEQKLSYSDYISICENFNIIILTTVPRISAGDNDSIIRFINLIDNVYSHNVQLFALFETSLEQTYASGPKLFEYKRALSRIVEMSSPSYLSI